MDFNISERTTKDLKYLYEGNSQARFGKTHFNVGGLTSSVPGGGKTRFLLELLNLLPDMEALYFVTFGNPAPISPFDRMQNRDSAGKSVAMRLLYHAIQSQGTREGQSFEAWVQEVHDLHLKDVAEIKNAIKMLGGDPGMKCLLAVDEVNKAQEHTTITEANSKEDSMSAIYMLIDVLSFAMLSSQVYSFMAGTSIRGSGRSGFSPHVLHLQCLSFAQQCAVVDKYPGLAGWRCSAEAKELFPYLAGLPRLLEIFIDRIIHHLGGTDNFGLVDWQDVRTALSLGAASERSWDLASAPLAQRLVNDIVLRNTVHPTDSIVRGLPETYESLQQHAQIALQPLPDAPWDLSPMVPFLTFWKLVDIARSSADNHRFQRLYNLIEANIGQPQSFETFVIEHSAIMNEFFQSPVYFGDYDRLPLSRRYAEGYGGAGRVHVKYLANQPEAVKGSASITTFTDGNYVCRIDWNFTRFRNEDIEGDMSNQDTPEDSRIDEWLSTQSIDIPRPSSLLVVAENHKQYSRNKLTFEMCVQEYEKHRAIWKKYRVVTVIIAADRIVPPENHQDYKNLLVIDITKFKDLYGILEPLLQPQLTTRLAINTVDEALLSQHLGEDIAHKIMREKGKGFLGKEDFQERMAKTGVLLEEEFLDDWEF